MARAAPGFEEHIPAWINTFDGLSSQCQDWQQLCDGVLLTEVVGQIAPAQVNYSVIRGESLAVHKTNLTHLTHALEDFYRVEIRKVG